MVNTGHDTVIENTPLTWVLAASVTLIVGVLVPVAVGVPEINPLVLIDTPAGNAPEGLDQEYGVVPPWAAICTL